MLKIIFRNFGIVALIFCSLASCRGNWKWLHEKDYYAPADCLTIEGISARENRIISDSLWKGCPTFLFKADELIFEKDTNLLVFGNTVPAKKFKLITAFKFQELRGVAAMPTKKSKNKLIFPVYFASGLPETSKDSLKHKILLEASSSAYSFNMSWRVFSKLDSEVTIHNSETARIYFVENQYLYIPRPLPEGQYGTPGCGVSGGGETFLWQGLTINHPNGVIFSPEEMFDLVLEPKEILRGQFNN